MKYCLHAFLWLVLATPVFAEECRVDGCSRQLCVESDSPPRLTTCEWQAAYACYGRFSRCEKQQDSNCGWSQTAELEKCLESPEQYLVNQDTHDRENH